MAEPQTPLILIVEDDPSVALLQRRKLERAGYLTRWASRIEEAWPILQQTRIDLVLLDYRLPGETTGLKFLQQLKEAGYDLPVILVTGFSDENTAIGALRAGVRDFLTKSPDYLTLLPDAVNRVLRQVRTERQLAESEARLSAIIDSAKDAVIVVEADRKITLFNAAAERMFRCPAAEAIGQPVTRFIPNEFVEEPTEVPPDPDKALGSFTTHLRAGTQGVRSNGEVFPLEKSASRVQVGGRKFYTILVRDITERRKAEQDLREREERFRSLCACSPIGIFLTDADGHVSYVNPRFAVIFGQEERQCKGEGWASALYPEDRDATLGQWYETVEGGREYAREYRLRTKGSGSSGVPPARWVHVKAVPLYGGDGPAGPRRLSGYVGTVEDITERVLAEKQLRDQATLLDRANDAILVRGLDDRIIYWNAGAERLYGWKREEALGREATELLKEGAESERARTTALTRGEWTGELDQHRRDGRKLTVLSRWALMRDGIGGTDSFLVINTDLTEKKVLEAQLQRVQRLESIGTLVGGIAHDLNNVLTPILMAAELLLTRILDAEGRNLLATLQASAERGADLVKQVLVFARGTEGASAGRCAGPLLVKEVSKLLKQTLPKSIVIEVDCPPDLWLLAADATQVHQVLMNLCVNARDAMPNGGRMTITARNGRISTPIRPEPTAGGTARPGSTPEIRPGPFVALSVQDTGTGIPPEIRDRIFEPFFTTKDVGKGTGLGLSTIRNILKSVGGFVGVQSEVGKGSTFTAYFPALEKAEPEPTSGQAAAPVIPAGRGEYILVVDDEAAVREVARAILEVNGYQVLSAANGAEAVALYAQHQGEIRAVITDMVMPVMDGPATIRALTRQDPQVRIIMASGYTGTEPGQDGTPLPGVRAVLAKPYSVESLLTTVREVLDK